MAKSTKASPTARTPAKPRKTAAKPSSVNGKVTQMPVPRERVAELAHQFWIQRGYQHGFDEEDWFRAEQQLRHKAS